MRHNRRVRFLDIKFKSGNTRYATITNNDTVLTVQQQTTSFCLQKLRCVGGVPYVSSAASKSDVSLLAVVCEITQQSNCSVFPAF